MQLTRFEALLPWSGVVAGLAWIGQGTLGHWQRDDTAGGGALATIEDHVALNMGSLACTVVMGVSLLFFATAVRNLLRSGEAREATYSSVAYAALVSVATCLGVMAVWDKAMLTAAEDSNGQVIHTLSYGQYFGWLSMGVGISTAFLAIGLGGVRSAVLPKWFAVTTTVLGVLALLGACAIPPGGLVNYLLLPFWLVAAAVIIARRQRRAAQPLSSSPEELASASRAV